MCKLLHQRAFHLWHVGVDLMHLPKLPMILGCHDFSLAPQLVSQSAGWFSTSSDLDHHLWQSKDAVPFQPGNHYKDMKVTKQIKYLKRKWNRKQATDLSKSQLIESHTQEMASSLEKSENVQISGKRVKPKINFQLMITSWTNLDLKNNCSGCLCWWCWDNIA